MTTDPRAALASLIAALERHYEASASSASRGGADEDPVLEAATDQLATAFDAYDDALFDAYDVATPLIVFDGDDDDDDDDDDFDDYDDLDDDEDEDDEPADRNGQSSAPGRR